MKRTLVIDGNAVYEIDEECVMQKQKELLSEDRRKRRAGGTSNEKCIRGRKEKQ